MATKESLIANKDYLSSALGEYTDKCLKILKLLKLEEIIFSSFNDYIESKAITLPLGLARHFEIVLDELYGEYDDHDNDYIHYRLALSGSMSGLIVKFYQPEIFQVNGQIIEFDDSLCCLKRIIPTDVFNQVICATLSEFAKLSAEYEQELEIPRVTSNPNCRECKGNYDNESIVDGIIQAYKQSIIFL
jgi:hypothetical protein